MTEAIETKEIIEQAEQEAAKPYTFRKLSSDDIFLMFTIIKKIGFKEFKKCFEGDTVNTLVSAFKSANSADKDESGADKALMAVGFAIGFDAVDVILGNLSKCKEEIYELLSQVSGMKIDEIRADGLLFTEMLIDFFKKPEFPGFIKVVSKLFK
jgi:hypothetical protein